MCMCLARGTVGGEGGKWMRGLNFGFTNPLGTGGVLDVCLCFGCGGVGGVGGSGFGQGSGEWVVLCLCKLCALTFCVDEGPGTCVLCLADTCASEVHPVFNPVAPYGYLLPIMYLFIANITNPESYV